MVLLAGIAAALIAAKLFDGWVKRWRAERQAALNEAYERAKRFNAQFPRCVFQAAPLKRRGVYRVGFYVRGRNRPAFTI